MTQHDWNAGAHCLGLFLNGEGITAPGPEGERVEDDSFLLLFNASADDLHVPTAEPALRRRSGRSCSTRPTPTPAAGLAARVGAQARARRDLALAEAAAPGGLTWRRSARPTGCSSGRSSTSPARRRSCPTCASSASRTCTSRPSFAAREGSTHGYDVVDPTRLSDALGGEAAFRALAAAARAAGLGIVLDIVPNHMATDDANPYWADPRAPRHGSSTSTPRPGRHRRFFDIDHLAGVRQEDPEVFAETHRLALGLVARGARRRAAGRPSRRARRPAGLPGAAARRRRRARLGGEDPRPRRAAARLARRGHGRLRVPQRRRRAVRRPGRRGAADRAVGRARAATRGRSASGRPRRSSSRRAPRSRPTSSGCARLWPEVEGLEEALAALPVYRTYIRDLAAPRGPARAARGGAGAEWLAPGAARTFVTRFQQTTPPIMAKGVEDTAFYRYVRLLAL